MRQSRLGITNRVIGAFMGAVAAVGLTAALALANDEVQTVFVESMKSLTDNEARKQSEGIVLLHFGNGFPELTAKSAASLLQDKGYEVKLFSGGPENNLRLYLDTKALDKNFNLETIGLLSTVVDHYGSHLKIKITSLLDEPSLDADGPN